MAALGIVLTAFFAIFLIAIVRGWVMTVLWSWFVVPTFHLPELSIPVAIGLSLMIGMFIAKRISAEKSEQKKSSSELVGEILGVGFGGPLLVLFFGWIITLFM